MPAPPCPCGVVVTYGALRTHSIIRLLVMSLRSCSCLGGWRALTKTPRVLDRHLAFRRVAGSSYILASSGVYSLNLILYYVFCQGGFIPRSSGQSFPILTMKLRFNTKEESCVTTESVQPNWPVCNGPTTMSVIILPRFLYSTKLSVISAVANPESPRQIMEFVELKELAWWENGFEQP